MAVRTSAILGKPKAIPRRTERSVRADLDNLEEFKARYEFLDDEADRLGQVLDKAKSELDEVRKNDVPALQRLQAIPGAPSTKRRENIGALQAKVAAAEAKVTSLQGNLDAVLEEKDSLEGFETGYETKRKSLESELARMTAKKPESKVESVPVAAAVATPASATASEAPKATESTSERADFDPLKTYPDAVLYELPPDERRRIVREHILWDEYRKAHPERVTAPAAAKPEATATATARSGGLPGWLWLILGILGVVLLIWWLSSLQTDKPTTTQRATAAPTAQAQGAGATFSEPVEHYGLDRNKNRVIARSNVPTTARLIWIDTDKVMAESSTAAQRHNLDWTVPQFAGDEKTFNMKVELKTADGKTTPSRVVTIKVLQNSQAAGGLQKPEHLAAFLKEPTGAVARDGYVSILKQVAPSYPGVSGLTSANLVSFVESNLGKFEVRTLTAPLTGEFAFVRSDGVVGYSPVTVPTGTPVLTFDGKVLANALCANEIKVPTTPVTTVPTPTPTPTTGKCVAEVWKYEDRNRNKVKDADEPWLPGFSFGVVGNGIQTTNASGVTVFTNLAGDRNVTVVEPRVAGWEPTGAESQTQYCPAGGTIRFYFGNARIITTTVTTPAPTPAPTAAPTPVPTPAPTPVWTKAPDNSVPTYAPPTGALTPPPSATPLPVSYSVAIVNQGPCTTPTGGSNCWFVTWRASGVTPTTSNGWVAYGVNGACTGERSRGNPDGSGNWTTQLYPLQSGRNYCYQAYTATPGGTEVASGVQSFIAP